MVDYIAFLFVILYQSSDLGKFPGQYLSLETILVQQRPHLRLHFVEYVLFHFFFFYFLSKPYVIQQYVIWSTIVCVLSMASIFFLYLLWSGKM